MATSVKFVKIKVIRQFYDKTEGLKLKKAGEELSVSSDRADKLISLGLAEKADAGAHEAAADKE